MAIRSRHSFLLLTLTVLFQWLFPALCLSVFRVKIGMIMLSLPDRLEVRSCCKDSLPMGNSVPNVIRSQEHSEAEIKFLLFLQRRD